MIDPATLPDITGKTPADALRILRPYGINDIFVRVHDGVNLVGVFAYQKDRVSVVVTDGLITGVIGVS